MQEKIKKLGFFLTKFIDFAFTPGMFLMLGFAVFAHSKNIGLAVGGQFLMTGVLGSPLVVFALTILPIAFISSFVAQLSTRAAVDRSNKPRYPLTGFLSLSAISLIACVTTLSYIFSMGATFPVIFGMTGMTWSMMLATILGATSFVSAKHVFSKNPSRPYAVLATFLGAGALILGTLCVFFSVASGLPTLPIAMLAGSSVLLFLFAIGCIALDKNSHLQKRGEKLLRSLQVFLTFNFLFLAFLSVVTVFQVPHLGLLSGTLTFAFNIIAGTLGYAGFQAGMQWLSVFSIAIFSISCFAAYELLKSIVQNMSVSENTTSPSFKQKMSTPWVSWLLKSIFIFGLMLPLLFVPNISKAMLYICLVQAIATTFFQSFFIKPMRGQESGKAKYIAREVVVVGSLFLIFTVTFFVIGGGGLNFAILGIWMLCGGGVVVLQRWSSMLPDYLTSLRGVSQKGGVEEAGEIKLEQIADQAADASTINSPPPQLRGEDREEKEEKQDLRSVFRGIIHFSRQKKKLELSALLKKGYTINLCYNKMTPVRFLAEKGDKETVEWLIKNFGTGLLNQAVWGVAKYAAGCEDPTEKCSYLCFMEFLISSGANFNYAARGAAEGGDFDLLVYLLDRGASPDLVISALLEGTISLAEVEVEDVPLLLDALRQSIFPRGASLDYPIANAQEAEEFLSVIKSVFVSCNGGGDPVHALLSVRESKYGRTFFQQYLCFAAGNGDNKLMEHLLTSDSQTLEEKGNSEKVFTFTDGSKHTQIFIEKAISSAAASGHFDLVHSLVDRCADTEKNALLVYAVAGAAEGGHFDFVAKLISYWPSDQRLLAVPAALAGAARGGHVVLLVALMKHYEIPTQDLIKALAEGGHMENKGLILYLLGGLKTEELHCEVLAGINAFYTQKNMKHLFIQGNKGKAEFVSHPPAEEKGSSSPSSVGLETLPPQKEEAEEKRPSQECLFEKIKTGASEQDKGALSALLNKDLLIDFRFKGMTAVRFFAEKGDIEAVIRLVNNFNAGLNQAVRGSAKYAAMCKNPAEKARHIAFMYCLMEKGASPDDAVRGAAEGGDYDLVKYLYTQGASVDDAILGAAEGGHVQLVETLICVGGSDNYPMASEEESSYFASLVGRLITSVSSEKPEENFLTVLNSLEANAVKAKNPAHIQRLIQTFLCLAVEQGKFDVVEALSCLDSQEAASEKDPEKVLTFSEGSNSRKNTVIFMRKAISSAAANGHFDFVERWIDRCCETKKDHLVCSAIVGAAEGGHFPFILGLREKHRAVDGIATAFDDAVVLGAGKGGHIEHLIHLMNTQEINVRYLIRGLREGKHLDDKGLIMRLLDGLESDKLRNTVLEAIKGLYQDVQLVPASPVEEKGSGASSSGELQVITPGTVKALLSTSGPSFLARSVSETVGGHGMPCPYA